MAQDGVKVLQWAADRTRDRPIFGVSGQYRQGYMVSDIKGLNSRQTAGTPQSAAASTAPDPRSSAAGKSSGVVQDDTVELSGLAEVIKATAKALASEPAVNQARVQELKTAVASGDYQIDPVRVAQKLIAADSL